MALLKSDRPARDAKSPAPHSSPLARVMCEFEELVDSFEAGLLRSLADGQDGTVADTLHLKDASSDRVRREACRLAISHLSNKYTPTYIRRSLDAAELEGKRVEDQLQSLSLNGTLDADTDADADADDGSRLGSLYNGYFRLYSTELFDLLGQPAYLRFGTLRFHNNSPAQHTHTASQDQSQPSRVSVELALNDSFFVADSEETLPYHTFRLPTGPSLQNRGILSRKPEDNGALPQYDSWLLFTFLGNGCIKLEVPIEMCADIYRGRLQGCENEEVLFWGFFVDDDDDE
ncbi:hypothetical protein COCC4DRAFT_34955 [Bipolaris maydis ATCC 48331]|uniref:Uncharacterized protein n=2 Tax=Cochliobolus heterostrophus TaxID=5016 RepID=M2TTI9_COCH5|nr:uncharacterized protein COCC4DRAFT_34955 [Bipolaris maydis ATCC 48331]EMD85086.1 hypothetical protein COCHEDRAFT_1229173 [Bipolaris maydis C5]KAH7559961.1 hypothetical protein BM1_03595 [Bipolaris maydis]ENH99250.1 hypothetical protein COCC4DRAFT_34955 [Bipolaris maydis ATCC 48331]KAJ5022520.1 hypothetical protein J3E73DRAFT_340171 [Bipolaris maydis]KAJ5064765.1 hypothetical protein J3E74DRAFT_463139 [Bipolaris maydis]